MKKIRFYPKLFINHFKKRPSRIVTWFSILAITFALVVTLINPNNIVHAAPGISITYDAANKPTTVSINGTDPNPNNLYFTDFNIAPFGSLYLNDCIIDSDGYLKIRWYPDRTARPYAFEYLYYHDSNKNRIKFDNTIDLTVSGNQTKVYMEGNKLNPVKFKNLTVDSATLTHVPANRDGLNAPFSSNNMWGIRLFGYYYLGPNREVSFFLDGNSTNPNSPVSANLKVNDGVFQKLTSIDSDYGWYQQDQTVPTTCSIDDVDNQWCDPLGGTPNKNQATVFQNKTPTGKYLSFDLAYYFHDTDTPRIQVNHRENQIIPFQELTTPGGDGDYIPALKFVGLNNDGSPIVAPGSDPNLPPSNGINTLGGTVAMAYYYSAFGVRGSYAQISSFGGIKLGQAARSFQTLNAQMLDDWRDPNHDTLFDFGKIDRTVDYPDGGNSYQTFEFQWDSDPYSGSNQKGNPISHSMFDYGEDYLRAPLASYVQEALIAENGELREARINIEIANNLTLQNNGSINASGKGYPGGVRTVGDKQAYFYSNPSNPQPISNLRYIDQKDDPIHGAGYGGGIGAWQNAEPDVYSGSYGGTGATTRVSNLEAESRGHRAIHASTTYGGADASMTPVELGSGGGYIQDRQGGQDIAAYGGAGGGAIHIKANALYINSGSIIKANGGNGFVGLGNDGSGKTISIYADDTNIELGKPGIKQLENAGNQNLFDGNNFTLPINPTDYDYKERGTAGSGGSIYIQTSQIANNGKIEARGAEGAGRIHTDISSVATAKYNQYYNSDNPILVCNGNIDPKGDLTAWTQGECQGPGAGGGRVAIYYDVNNRADGTMGPIYAWGGGVNDNGAEQLNDLQESISNIVGTAGTVYYAKNLTNTVSNKVISIDKSVNLCLLDQCADGPTDLDANPDIDAGNATASDDAWMLVQIRLINNTGKDQNNISITDEKFHNATSWTQVTQEGAFDSATDPAEIKWNNISIPTGAPPKILEYYFKISF